MVRVFPPAPDGGAARPPVASATAPRRDPLGEGRYRARMPRAQGSTRLDVYTCDDPPSCLVARTRGRVRDVLVVGELSGGAAQNLGDCLVGAVAAGLARVVLRLGRRDVAALEAEAVLESFGRYLAWGEGSCQVRLRGAGPGLAALALALGRGLAAARRGRQGPAARGVRP